MLNKLGSVTEVFRHLQVAVQVNLICASEVAHALVQLEKCTFGMINK